MELFRTYHSLKALLFFCMGVFLTGWAWYRTATEFRLETTLALFGPATMTSMAYMTWRTPVKTRSLIAAFKTLLFLAATLLLGVVAGFFYKIVLHIAYPHAVVVPFSLKPIQVSN